MKLFDEETITIDDIQCVYCGYKFYGRDACNANMDCRCVTCPSCKKDLNIFISIEYTCLPMEEEYE